jgi:hypothetical protein
MVLAFPAQASKSFNGDESGFLRSGLRKLNSFKAVPTPFTYCEIDGAMPYTIRG